MSEHGRGKGGWVGACASPLLAAALVLHGGSCTERRGPGPADTGFEGCLDAACDAPPGETGPDAPEADDAPGARDAPPPRDAAASDARPDAGEDDPLCTVDRRVPAGCVEPLEEGLAGRCNGLDDDCDARIDEGCACALGEVRPCFAGPPGRRGVGACTDGTQQCTGGEEFGEWGPCLGGIVPADERCNGLDDDCDGCTDDLVGCVPGGTCPGPDDPRIPEAAPFVDVPLRGSDFYGGEAVRWTWTVEGGPCDAVLPRPSFGLWDADQETARFRAGLSGDYTVTMTVEAPDGSLFRCVWVLHVRGPGLRVELCYPESETVDLDLHLSAPGSSAPWFLEPDRFRPSPTSCGWHNCEALLRGVMAPGGIPYPRADWGHAPSPLAACEGGPLGPQWTELGFCANPRLDIDNNLVEGIGVPENINVDAPRDGDRFRVMVHNFTGLPARPLVNVYCDGRRLATFGAAPDEVPAFADAPGDVGAMWRVADVTTHRGAEGALRCEVEGLHAPWHWTGYDVSYDDARF
jgi:hypothetical protein